MGILAKLTTLFAAEPGGEKPAESRSPHWPAVERNHLNLEPVCQLCGEKNDLNVHHIQPFHTHPELELDPTNLITLCRPHHLLAGHLMLWKSINADCRADVKAWRGKINRRP